MSTDILKPTSSDEVVSVVADAIAQKTSFEIRGGGTRGLGRPVQADKILSTEKLSGITLYEPKELAISVLAGTPLSDVQAALAAEGQMLPFEPMDHCYLSGQDGTPTIGGVVAANVSGPRRVTAGAARDYLIGAKLVNGRAEPVKSGGRVMKNVTGLDVAKLMCGAHGTLGILTEVTFKVLPLPQHTESLVFAGLNDTDAVQLMSSALGSSHGVSGAVHVPALGGSVARTILRVEGFEASVKYRVQKLADLLTSRDPAEIIVGPNNLMLWGELADVKALEVTAQNVWRISIAASKAVSLIQAIDPDRIRPHVYGWGGGLIWLATPATDFNIGTHIQKFAAEFGGHATLVRASEGFREQVEVFQPLSDPMMLLTRGVKNSFDPDAIFNFGRMYRGI